MTGEVKACVVAVGLLVLVWIALPGAGSADHTFGPDVGWKKTSVGKSLQVVNLAEGVDVGGVIAPWNALAGWPLFADFWAGPWDADSLDIWILRGGATYVLPVTNVGGDYRWCIIWTDSTSTHVLQHEIGHCLGFADHVFAWQFGYAGYVNPAVCDDPQHPAYSAYRGVMSYCDWFGDTRFGGEDWWMLWRAGYAR